MNKKLVKLKHLSKDNMNEFYWKKRESYYDPDYYVSSGGKVFGELADDRRRGTWTAYAWNEEEHKFTLLGFYVTEEKAKIAIEKYCEENYNEEKQSEKILL